VILVTATFGVPGTASGAMPRSVPIDSAPIETSVATTTDAGPTTVPDATDDAPSPATDTADVDDDDRSVSIGWWIGGIVVAAAAAFGIAYSLRRRTDTEEWARRAAVVCDIGRATSLTLIAQLDEPVWSRPPRYDEQHRRFDGGLTELHRSVPDRDFPELLDAVIAADDALTAAVGRVADGATIASARSTIEPAIDDLSTALDALEQGASIAIFGAALPSSRTTG